MLLMIESNPNAQDILDDWKKREDEVKNGKEESNKRRNHEID